jgi:nifR3 family TIM-barrel protein
MKLYEIYDSLHKPFLILAPMDDVTDTVFRQVVSDCAPPDLFFTEFVNVDGLQSVGRPNLMKRLISTKSDQPLVAQIWGLNPDNFYKTAQDIASGELGNFVGIDLNMGCPIKTIVKNGACSALMLNRDLAVEIIQATKKGAGKLPVSVKTRLGYNEYDPTWHELLFKQDLAMLTIHGRTRSQMSKAPANWELIGEIARMRDKLSPQTLIVGNGDVESRKQAVELADKYKLDGVMIGRGIFQDPFIFSDNSPWSEYTKNQKLELYAKHIKLFAKTWQNNERAVHTLNKFCKIYVNGFDNAKEIREELMASSSTEELLKIIQSNV